MLRIILIAVGILAVCALIGAAVGAFNGRPILGLGIGFVAGCAVIGGLWWFYTKCCVIQ